MTSAPSMLPGLSRLGIALGLALAALTGCAERLTDPVLLQTPYATDQLWGVAPFANESGASAVDGAKFGDAFMMQAQQVDGIDVIPVNRVIAAMRAAGMPAVRSPADAETIMKTLRLDGLVVGTITGYDPYRPMKLGMAAELYTRPVDGRSSGLDPRALTRSTRGEPAFGDLGPSHPTAGAAGVFDAANHHTIQQVEAFAAGRADPESAFGEDIYLVSMDWYAQFVCHRLLHDLLANERTRTAAAAEDTR